MKQKYTLADIEKGLAYLKKNCQSVYIGVDIDDMGRLILKGSDLVGNAIRITIFDESTQKMAEINKTERL